MGTDSNLVPSGVAISLAAFGGELLSLLNTHWPCLQLAPLPCKIGIFRQKRRCWAAVLLAALRSSSAPRVPLRSPRTQQPPASLSGGGSFGESFLCCCWFLQRWSLDGTLWQPCGVFAVAECAPAVLRLVFLLCPNQNVGNYRSSAALHLGEFHWGNPWQTGFAGEGPV